MTISRGFTRCDECGGKGRFKGMGLITGAEWTYPCEACDGSGLVPTEELRNAARTAAVNAFGESENRTTWSWPQAVKESADAVLRKVAEHIREGR